ncbi:hypothetical protein Tco_1093359 [Tanacetum coccineum]|uniref:Reverse transcriptase domain-containing protein n=1 Tax=Tanacetum coccineum TaxID=301880 RepID=A0ABQ5IDN7_9ASTR
MSSMFLGIGFSEWKPYGGMEASQKAKIKWAIEGDENSKYYHGILNKKRNQLSIRGVLVENPNMVKNEFLNHFNNRFDKRKPVRPMLNMEFPHHLNSMQQLDLEAEVSNEEIKKAVWDCGVDKSPGPDGFTFALIPKTPKAKMVKDFRPISLIGSLYKIIAKILANRLVVVLGDFVNEVQSAFVVDRQILDGPFILNEVLQWCLSINLSKSLSINLSKSKLLGVVVSEDRVVQAANRIGCGVLKAPFAYLGLKVRRGLLGILEFMKD